jgi:glycosyltransferase involved in cell wall biosynthesis
MSGDPGDLVSVVIATYNMGRYLGEAVHSVLVQSYPNVEVQIIDDGSIDETATILRQWDTNPRVRVYRQPNGGQAKAKNAGIALSRGAFIAFLDADDVWLPEKLTLQMPLFTGRPEVGVVFSDYERMDAEGQPLPKGRARMHRGAISGALLIDNFIPFPTVVVRRECLEQRGVFDESLGMGIDYDLWLRLSAYYAFDFVAEPTARYRIWAGQMSKNYRKRYESGIRIMQSFLERHPGVVRQSAARRAWAHTYTGRGNSTLWQEKDRAAALRDYLRALSFRPGYWPAWRAVLRSLVTTRAP